MIKFYCARCGEDLCQLTVTCSRVLEQLRVRSASQMIFCLLWGLKVHCHVHKSLPPASLLSQMNPVPSFKRYFIKINFNIIHPCDLFPPGFSSKIQCEFLTSPMHATYSARLAFPDLITLIIFDEAYKFRSPSFFSFVQPCAQTPSACVLAST